MKRREGWAVWWHQEGSWAFMSICDGCQRSLGKPEFWSQWLISPTLGRLFGKVLVHIIIIITRVFALALRMEFLSVVENLVPGQILADVPLLSFRILLQIKLNKQTLLLTSSFRLGDYQLCKLVLFTVQAWLCMDLKVSFLTWQYFHGGGLIFLCDS